MQHDSNHHRFVCGILWGIAVRHIKRDGSLEVHPEDHATWIISSFQVNHVFFSFQVCVKNLYLVFIHHPERVSKNQLRAAQHKVLPSYFQAVPKVQKAFKALVAMILLVLVSESFWKPFCLEAPMQGYRGMWQLPKSSGRTCLSTDSGFRLQGVVYSHQKICLELKSIQIMRRANWKITWF